MDIIEILDDWETEQYKDWYAVDELKPASGKKPFRVIRLMVTSDRDDAKNRAARFAAGYDLDDGEPGEIGEQPFYRCTIINPTVAHDYLTGLTLGYGGEMLTLTDAANVARVSRQAMLGRIERGTMAAELIGNTWYVLESSIRLF